MVRLLGVILASALVLLAAVEIRSGKAAAERAVLQLGPMLGHVWGQGARIWIKTSKLATSTVVIGERPDLRDGRRVGGPNLTAESDFMGIVEIAGLRPATRYYYRMLIDDRATPPAATFSLVTPPPPDAAGRLRFAVTSCVGLPEEAAPAWADLAKVPIDLLLQLGDNVYAGSTDPEVQRRTYYAHRRIPADREVVARTPTWAIWDDWDYAGSNSDGTAATPDQPGRRSGCDVAQAAGRSTQAAVIAAMWR